MYCGDCSGINTAALVSMEERRHGWTGARVAPERPGSGLFCILSCSKAVGGAGKPVSRSTCGSQQIVKGNRQMIQRFLQVILFQVTSEVLLPDTSEAQVL